MTFQDIISIIAVFAEIFVFLAFLYYRARGDVVEKIVELIALAEKTGKPGPEKMDMVVDGLYRHMPVIFHKILTKDRLRKIAQYVFDWMKEYALEYLEKKREKEAGEGIEDPAREDEGLFEEEVGIVPEIEDGE